MGAAMTLTSRAEQAGIEALPLSPRLGDFNEDLRKLGLEELRAAIRSAAPARGRRPLPSADCRPMPDNGRRLRARYRDRPVSATSPLSERAAPTAF